MNVFISPRFRGEDSGDGGIRRVVEAQMRYLPEYNINVVENEKQADLIALHAGSWIEESVPKVAHCHGLYWGEYEWPKWCYDLNRRVTQTILKADAVSAPSEWVAQAMRRNFWLDPTVLGHGIDLDQWSPSTDPQRYVLWNKTRIDPVCDPEPLERLVEMVPNIDFTTTFRLPPETQRLSYDNLRVTGRLSYEQAKGYIQNAGVYLCTSRETFGIGTLEAMACGVPILGWAWGGQAEIIEHKTHGWLARPGDYDSLLAGLYYCLENRAELGANARQLIKEKYQWQTVMKGYATLYEQVLAGQPKVKVSVIITCYNLAEYLPKAVESVLEQDMKDFEIIIVDDASPDNTPTVAQALCNSDSRIKYMRNDKNLYLAGALNAGINEARGKYIVPLDADNMLGTNALRLMTNALDQDSGLDIAYGAMSVIDNIKPEWISTWPPQVADFRSQMMHRNQVPSTSMYRKKIWERIGGYRKRCKTGEDADFWCRALSFGARAEKVTDAVTLRYVDRQDSMSHVNKDWPWEAWYPWSNDLSLTPPGAVQREGAVQPKIMTYEPPLISVIIPIGPGHEEIWIDAVDSIVAQTFTKWEVILVNDTGKEFSWKHPFAKMISTDGSLGVARARNMGIAASKAQLFIPLDADDYLQPTALERFYDVYKQFGGYVYSDWYMHETKELKETDEYRCEDLLHSLPHAVTALYPKAAWRAADGFDENLDSWEDWDFVIKLANMGYCGTRIPEPLFMYRMQAGKRREELLARKEQSKQNIYNKWSDLISGRKTLMACGGCSRGGGGLLVKGGSNEPANQQSSIQGDTSRQDMVLLEFVGTGAGNRTYIGATTNTKYRFGSDPDHRIRLVHKADAQDLLRFKDVFKIVEKDRVLV